jgi:heme-degrading monooxygenase HmoA
MTEATNAAGETIPAQITDGIDPRSTWLSLLQFFVRESEKDAFQADMEEMYELAQKQPGYLWGHYGRSMVDGRWFVVSEWTSYEEMKAWEHEARHEEVGDINGARYEFGRDMQNRKFVPWYKPGADRKAWTK